MTLSTHASQFTPLIDAAFKAAAPYYHSASVLPQLVGKRLLERTEIFQFEMQHILDLGCGTGFCFQALKKHYPTAHVIGIDRVYDMLQQISRPKNWWYPASPTLACADIMHLPFANEQFDLVCANLSLHWLFDLKQGLLELKRILKPKGILLFTMLGPNTFIELQRENLPEFENQPFSWVYRDLHTTGNLLASAKFVEVVTDIDHFKLKYRNLHHFQSEMKQLGLQLLLPDSLAPDTSPKKAANTNIPMFTPFPITLEIVYAYAWKSARDQTQDKSPQEAVISTNYLAAFQEP